MYPLPTSPNRSGLPRALARALLLTGLATFLMPHGTAQAPPQPFAVDPSLPPRYHGLEIGQISGAIVLDRPYEQRCVPDGSVCVEAWVYDRCVLLFGLCIAKRYDLGATAVFHSGLGLVASWEATGFASGRDPHRPAASACVSLEAGQVCRWDGTLSFLPGCNRVASGVQAQGIGGGTAYVVIISGFSGC